MAKNLIYKLISNISSIHDSLSFSINIFLISSGIKFIKSTLCFNNILSLK